MTDRPTDPPYPPGPWGSPETSETSSLWHTGPPPQEESQETGSVKYERPWGEVNACPANAPAANRGRFPGNRRNQIRTEKFPRRFSGNRINYPERFQGRQRSTRAEIAFEWSLIRHPPRGGEQTGLVCRGESTPRRSRRFLPLNERTLEKFELLRNMWNNDGSEDGGCHPSISFINARGDDPPGHPDIVQCKRNC